MPRPLLRIAALSGLVIVLWVLSSTLEFRRTAYSCRTLWSCLGFGVRHVYEYPLSDHSPPLEHERILRDGTTRYDSRTLNADPGILILVLSKDATSWSSDFRSSQRTAYDFTDLLISTKLNLTDVALAMMTASVTEYESMKAASAQLPFGRVTLLFDQNARGDVQYENRHDPRVQLARRSALAIMRNRLMASALEDEQHVVWLDADVVELSQGIVQTMLRHSGTEKDAGIITAMCHQNQMNNYDKNAWKLNDDTLMGLVADEDREDANKRLVETRLMLPQVIAGTDDNALLPINSVGGTILYMRAELIRQGLNFPHANIVGTTWNQAGWIGVETEGLCYLARGLDGGACYVLGGSHHARHTDWG